MNRIMVDYKKVLIAALMTTAIGQSTMLLSVCSPCQAAAAERKSKQDALAAALAAGKPATKEAELDIPDKKSFLYQSLKETLAALITLGVNFDEINEVVNKVRAPREALNDPCNTFICEDKITPCQLNEQLQSLSDCCAHVSLQLKHQGHDARKCCKKIRHEINEVEELVETVIDQVAECCDITEELLISIIDQTADCCTVTEGLIISVIDQTAVCCSVTDGLIVSVIDTIGDPATSSIVDIPLCLPISIADSIINGLDVDAVTLLKTLLELVYRIHICTCCNF